MNIHHDTTEQAFRTDNGAFLSYTVEHGRHLLEQREHLRGNRSREAPGAGHASGQFFPALQAGQLYRRMDAAWTPIDDSAEENDCLWVVPGSHRHDIYCPETDKNGSWNNYGDSHINPFPLSCLPYQKPSS